MNTEIISPRMLEAGEKAARAAYAELCIGDPLDEWVTVSAAAIYEAMHAKHIESLGGGEGR